MRSFAAGKECCPVRRTETFDLSGLDAMPSAAKRLEQIDIPRPLPLRMMLDQALEMGLISEVERRDIRKWMGVRNTAVHEGEAVSAKVVKSIVDGVNRIIGKIIGKITGKT